MRAVLQRVSRASVTVNGQTIGAIDRGLLMLLGVSKHDAQDDCDYIVHKTLAMRIFEDEQGKMNRSIAEIGGGILVVSQFTLYADARRGNRPGFDMAASPEIAEHWYERVIEQLPCPGIKIAAGQFRAQMEVELINDGPVTVLLDSGKAF